MELLTVEPPRTCRRIFEPQAPASPQGVRVERVTVERPSGLATMPAPPRPQAPAPPGQPPRGLGARVHPKGSGWIGLAPGFAPRGPGGAADGGAPADLPADLRAPGPGFTPWGPASPGGGPRAPGVRLHLHEAPRSRRLGSPRGVRVELLTVERPSGLATMPADPSPRPRLHLVNLPEVLVFRFTPKGPGGAGAGGALADLPALPNLPAGL